MRFSFEKIDLDLYGGLVYIQNEYSLMYEPHCPNIGVSIMCGEYTSLDTICETGVIVHISGLNSKQKWIYTNTKIPNSIKGILTAHFDTPPLKGTGINYDRNWKTYFNETETSLCIGDTMIEDNDDCIEFANGIIAVLRNNNLVAIWAKFREV
jgi:hypothetical protein